MSLSAHFVNVVKTDFVLSNFTCENVTVAREGMNIKALSDVNTEM